MSTSKFATGKYAHGFCDVCNFRYSLGELTELIRNEVPTGIYACPTCFDSDHPQYRVGKFPIDDPQALRDPRPDPSLEASRELL